jgi:hypothetical protein
MFGGSGGAIMTIPGGRVNCKNPLQVIPETSLCAHHRHLLIGRVATLIAYGAAFVKNRHPTARWSLSVVPDHPGTAGKLIWTRGKSCIRVMYFRGQHDHDQRDSFGFGQPQPKLGRTDR